MGAILSPPPNPQTRSLTERARWQYLETFLFHHLGEGRVPLVSIAQMLLNSPHCRRQAPTSPAKNSPAPNVNSAETEKPGFWSFPKIFFSCCLTIHSAAHIANSMAPRSTCYSEINYSDKIPTNFGS